MYTKLEISKQLPNGSGYNVRMEGNTKDGGKCVKVTHYKWSRKRLIAFLSKEWFYSLELDYWIRK